MRRQIVMFLAGSAIACGGEPMGPEPSNPAPHVVAEAGAGSWVARQPYPVDIFDATSASITASGRTTIYVIGGFPKCCNNGNIKDAVRAYDVATNTWRRKASYPVPIRSTNGAAVLGGKIYVTGGFTRRQLPDGRWALETLKSVYVYTPSLNTWTRKRDMPVTSVHGATVAYQGKLYVAADDIVWRYDPGTDQWTRFAERPQGLGRLNGGVIGGKLYLIQEFTGELNVLDLATGTWTTGPKRPYRACNAASATLQAKLYLFGFCDDFPTDPETRDRGLVFDPATSTWSEVAPAPIDAGFNAALARVVVNGRLRLSLVRGTEPNNHYFFVP